MEVAATAGGAVSVIDGLRQGYETVLGPTFWGARPLRWRMATHRNRKGFYAGNTMAGGT